MADTVGAALADRLVGPLRDAARNDGDEAMAGLEQAVGDALRNLPLPDAVDRVVAGTRVSTIEEGGLTGLSTALVVVPHGPASMFCIVLAVTSDGRYAARPVRDDPLQRCDNADLIDLPFR
jgi:hypothetical protein